jgi:hypothetical protein
MVRKKLPALCHPGAGRRRGRGPSALDLEVGGLAGFVARTAETLHALMSRRLDDVRLAV